MGGPFLACYDRLAGEGGWEDTRRTRERGSQTIRVSVRHGQEWPAGIDDSGGTPIETIGFHSECGNDRARSAPLAAEPTDPQNGQLHQPRESLQIVLFWYGKSDRNGPTVPRVRSTVGRGNARRLVVCERSRVERVRATARRRFRESWAVVVVRSDGRMCDRC